MVEEKKVVERPTGAKVHYDNDGNIKGFYADELSYDSVPEPNCELNEQEWKDARSNQGKYIIRDGCLALRDKPQSELDLEALSTVMTNRINAYGSVEEQLEMQYNDLVNGTTTWKDHRASVDSANPRP